MVEFIFRHNAAVPEVVNLHVRLNHKDACI